VEAFEDTQEQVANGATLNGAPIKAWAYRAAKIVDCIRNCHDNDQESFLLANAHFKHPSSTVQLERPIALRMKQINYM